MPVQVLFSFREFLGKFRLKVGLHLSVTYLDLFLA